MGTKVYFQLLFLFFVIRGYSQNYPILINKLSFQDIINSASTETLNSACESTKGQVFGRYLSAELSFNFEIYLCNSCALVGSGPIGVMPLPELTVIPVEKEIVFELKLYSKANIYQFISDLLKKVNEYSHVKNLYISLQDRNVDVNINELFNLFIESYIKTDKTEQNLLKRKIVQKEIILIFRLDMTDC